MIRKQQSYTMTILLLTLAFVLPNTTTAAEQVLQLRRGDHICYIGNTLADRMQHHAWMETYIQSIHPKHALTFRNLGFAGDEVKSRPRSDNFGTPDQWLTKTKADIVFCFFGYNEALRGISGLSVFETDLAEMIDGMSKQKYNGKSAPRLVVFSPIAHEDLHSPNLPDGTKNNKNLELYTRAMKNVCASKGVTFVDLFTPTRELYRSAKKPLTMNGIHLLEHGNRALANVVVKELFGRSVKTGQSEKQLQRLRNAILERNLHWFSRYRVVDGYNVYGGRSKLAWFGQSNADVMRREMEIFDVMTANRDKRVWAVAQGRDLKVVDNNLPKQVAVKTNKPGALKDGKHMYVGTVEAIGKMKLADGMQVNLFASEKMFPEMVNPVQMAVDTDGRLFVSVWPSYPHWNPTQPRTDRLLCFPDENGDGVADKCIVFADKLNSITGFEFWGGGVLVAAPPEIWFLKDTDGDDRADVKIRMLQGLSSADTHHSANAMVIGPDGGLYWSRGIFNTANMETPTKTYRSIRSGVHRFDPRTFEVDFHFPIGPNPHGDFFDQWGFQFANDGTSGTGSYVNIGKGLGNKKWFRKRVRPVAATGILSSSHFPEHNNGNFLICNTIGVLGVLQHKVKYNGADISAEEIEPILLSSDPNFRPTDIEIGGDGALYVSDWSNALIGHMQHNMRDPNRDHAHGRIYRVTYKGRPLLKPVKMKGKPIETVLQAFFAKENGTRYRARLELSGRDTKEVTAKVSNWARRLSPSKAIEAQALLECLWVFEEHRVPNLDLLKTVLKADEPRVRAAAIRTLGHWGQKVNGWQPVLAAAARDESALVQAEAVKAAVSFEGQTAAEIIFEIAAHPGDPELAFVLNYAQGQLNIGNIIQEAEKTGTPLSPAARAYILRTAGINDLLKLGRNEVVYRAILTRKDIAISRRRDALVELSAMKKAASLNVLLDLIEKRDARGQGGLVSLGQLLAERPAVELQKVHSRIERLAVKGKAGETRHLGYAAWIAADGSSDDAFLAASKSKNRLRDFLLAVPKIVNERLRSQVYSKVEPLVFELPPNLKSDSGDIALHDLAIRTLALIPGHEKEKFVALAALVKAGKHRASAIGVLRGISPEHWTQKEVSPLVDNLIGYLSNLPAKVRTRSPAKDAITLVKSLSTKIPPDQEKVVLDRLQNLNVRVIAIGTVPHRMIFDKEQIVVQAGKPVEFRFSNTDNMPHNFAIIRPGALEEIGLLAEATARNPDAISRHYIPKSKNILLASRLLQPGQNQALSFEAPKTPGVYPYVCTYPGHWRRMYGALYVVKDVKKYQSNPAGYLAANPLPPQDELLTRNTRGREWKFAELAADVKPLPSGRSFEVGKQVFKVSSCVSCHRLDNEGVVFGPDLTKLDEKKHSTEYILRSLLEPSKDIDPKYQSYRFALDSGKIITGMIVEETPATVKVVIDPIAKGKPTLIEKSKIDDRVKSTISIMPKGLLNKLSREEILDLVAYIYAGGDKKHKLFEKHHQH